MKPISGTLPKAQQVALVVEGSLVRFALHNGVVMELAAIYESLRQELAVNPHWAVRVEESANPSGAVGYRPHTWIGLPTPQSELSQFYDYAGKYPTAMRNFIDEHGGFNCAANHDTFEAWWPFDAVQRAAGYEMQITVIDLSSSAHLKLPMQTLIKRDKCAVVKTITLH